ncbi:MAG: hypothetical protein J0H68_01820 [Sphingobacteriia bacterium]|nr:hypothetical protein [Sphingobacteriia bacterium]
MINKNLNEEQIKYIEEEIEKELASKGFNLIKDIEYVKENINTLYDLLVSNNLLCSRYNPYSVIIMLLVDPSIIGENIYKKGNFEDVTIGEVREVIINYLDTKVISLLNSFKTPDNNVKWNLSAIREKISPLADSDYLLRENSVYSLEQIKETFKGQHTVQAKVSYEVYMTFTYQRPPSPTIKSRRGSIDEERKSNISPSKEGNNITLD